MEAKKLFAVVGTDARQTAAGRVLERAGYAVGGAEQVALADYILLPLPLDAARTPLAELLRAAKPGAVALGGRLSVQAKTIAQKAGVELVDYFARPELTVYNAIPTAEGCIGILLAERTRTLWGTNLLLLGFGPVGQALGARLAALGANVTVCARRAEQRALAESLGLRGAELARLAALAPAFDTVVNTIPAPVLTEPVLAALRPGSLIVDLASKPGGTDFAAAQRLGCKAIHALSLPAACAPDTAGEAVARTVLTICGSGRNTHENAEKRTHCICGVRQLLHTGSGACGSAAADRTGLGAAAHHELCRKAGHPLWHRAVLAGTAGSPYRPCSAGHIAGRGAAWP